MAQLIALCQPRDNRGVRLAYERMLKAVRQGADRTPYATVLSDCGVAVGPIVSGLAAEASQRGEATDRCLAVAVDGEILGHDQLQGRIRRGTGHSQRRDAADVILELYTRHGDECIKHLEGFFCFIIWDDRRRVLLVANDRYGFRPIYYTLDGGTFALCSELRGLLALPSMARALDYAAVADWFSFGHHLGDKTFFRDIRLLPPASLWRYDCDGATLHRTQYWHPAAELTRKRECRLEEHLERLHHLFRRAMSRQAPPNQRVCLSLTAGLDSRAALAAIDDPWRVIPFVHGDPSSYDFLIAPQVAQAYGCSFRCVPLANNFLRQFPELADRAVRRSEGLAKMGLWPVIYSRERMAAEASTEVNCSGADYTRGWGLKSLIGQSKSEDEFVANTKRCYSMGIAERQLLTDDLFRRIDGRATESVRLALRDPGYGLSYLDRGNLFYIREHVRRLTMASWALARPGLEYRLPYYDYSFFDALLQTPYQLLTPARLVPRYIIEHNAPRVARVPTAINYLKADYREDRLGKILRRSRDALEFYGRKYIQPVLPSTRSLFTFSRPYAPFESWIRRELRGFTEGVLLDRKTLGRGIYAQEHVRTLLGQHARGTHDWSTQIGLMIGFEMWLRVFVDGDRP